MEVTSKPMHILCTGGAGYIGSHTVLELLHCGHYVTVIDSLSNSSLVVIERVKELAGANKSRLEMKVMDLRDKEGMMKMFVDNKFDAVIHYAGLKAVGESVEKPLDYYDNNIIGTLTLLRAMMSVSACRTFVFSSSATVYKPSGEPVHELSPLGPSNPYGQTKLFIEQILKDLQISEPSLKVSVLRYFNPVGADPSGRIGESPEQPQNLLPYITQVAVGRKSCLRVFGNDWNTPDGTGVRDYIHVKDLALGHIAALNKLNKETGGCYLVHNIGTGKGISVLELKAWFEKACGKTLQHEVIGRRTGDLACVIADPSKAERDLGWKAKHTIEEACSSSWNWQSNNPYGYASQQASIKVDRANGYSANMSN